MRVSRDAARPRIRLTRSDPHHYIYDYYASKLVHLSVLAYGGWLVYQHVVRTVFYVGLHGAALLLYGD